MAAAENHAWVILTSRYGGCIRDPSSADLVSSIAELYHEEMVSMTEGDYAEHPNAWLEYGFDEGPMYILEVYRGGRVVFGQWADQDYESKLAPESSMEGVSEKVAVQLWTWLAHGDIDRIKIEPWNVN